MYGPRRGGTLLRVAVAAAICLASTAAKTRQGEQPSDRKVFTTRAIATVLQQIGGDLERMIGRQLRVTTDGAIQLVHRVKAGRRWEWRCDPSGLTWRARPSQMN